MREFYTKRRVPHRFHPELLLQLLDRLYNLAVRGIFDKCLADRFDPFSALLRETALFEKLAELPETNLLNGTQTNKSCKIIYSDEGDCAVTSFCYRFESIVLDRLPER